MASLTNDQRDRCLVVLILTLVVGSALVLLGVVFVRPHYLASASLASWRDHEAQAYTDARIAQRMEVARLKSRHAHGDAAHSSSASASASPYASTIAADSFHVQLGGAKKGASMLDDTMVSLVNAAHAASSGGGAGGSVAIFVQTSAGNHASRYTACKRTWIAEALASGFDVIPYSSHTESQLKKLEPSAVLLPAAHKDPDYDIRKASVAMFTKYAREHPAAKFILHAEDDTYIDVAHLRALLAQLDPGKRHYIGRRMTHEKQHTPAYCGNDMIIYSAKLWRDVDAAKPDIEQLTRQYFDIRGTYGHHDNVLMGFILNRLAGVSCEMPRIRDTTSDLCIYGTGSETHSFSRKTQTGTVSWTRLFNRCMDKMHEGNSPSNC